jgi:hypothetical protein
MTETGLEFRPLALFHISIKKRISNIEVRQKRGMDSYLLKAIKSKELNALFASC